MAHTRPTSSPGEVDVFFFFLFFFTASLGTFYLVSRGLGAFYLVSRRFLRGQSALFTWSVGAFHLVSRRFLRGHSALFTLSVGVFYLVSLTYNPNPLGMNKKLRNSLPLRKFALLPSKVLI